MICLLCDFQNPNRKSVPPKLSYKISVADASALATAKLENALGTKTPSTSTNKWIKHGKYYYDNTQAHKGLSFGEWSWLDHDRRIMARFIELVL
jgi:hypothetical protein